MSWALVYEAQKQAIVLLRHRITRLEAERDDAVRKASEQSEYIQSRGLTEIEFAALVARIAELEREDMEWDKHSLVQTVEDNADLRVKLDTAEARIARLAELLRACLPFLTLDAAPEAVADKAQAALSSEPTETEMNK